MDIVKKNMWSIVCGVVAVLAVVSTYYPLSGKFVELDQKLQASVTDHGKLKQLNNPSFNMPVIDPKTSVVKPLGQFPTQKVIDRGKEVVAKVHTESEKLQQKAMEMNKRTPLVFNAFPNGRGQHLTDFKDEYYRGLAQMKVDMNATSVPSEQEIKDRIDEVWKNEYEPLLRRVNE